MSDVQKRARHIVAQIDGKCKNRRTPDFVPVSVALLQQAACIIGELLEEQPRTSPVPFTLADLYSREAYFAMELREIGCGDYFTWIQEKRASGYNSLRFYYLDVKVSDKFKQIMESNGFTVTLLGEPSQDEERGPEFCYSGELMWIRK